MNGPLRVVVADDEYDVRLLLRTQLREIAGMELVGEAADGQRCVELCREFRPDAVVMDLLMPKMDGFAAISLLQHEFPELGIVAYTAVAGDFVRQQMRRLGIEVVLKAGDMKALAAALRRSVQPATAPAPEM